MKNKESLHVKVKNVSINAGSLVRHPRCQRKSPLERWIKKVGRFDLAKVLNPIHVVTGSKPGMYWVIDGATRVEACQADPAYGKNTMLPCRVYGNGKEPSDAELAEIFSIINSDVTVVSRRVAFGLAVVAERENALFAQEQINRLGPKFHSEVCVWRMTEKYGQDVVEEAVEFVLSVWGTNLHLPGPVFSAVGDIIADKKGAHLQVRLKRLRKEDPEKIHLRAQNTMYNERGKRPSLQFYVVRELLGAQVGTKSKIA